MQTYGCPLLYGAFLATPPHIKDALLSAMKKELTEQRKGSRTQPLSFEEGLHNCSAGGGGGGGGGGADLSCCGWSPTISGPPRLSVVAVFGPPCAIIGPLAVFSYESKVCLPQGSLVPRFSRGRKESLVHTVRACA